MKLRTLVYVLIPSLVCAACTLSTELSNSPGKIDPTVEACHVDPEICATLTPSSKVSHTDLPATLPGPIIHEQPGPVYETVIQIPVGESGILYRKAGVEDKEPVGPNGLVVTSDGIFIIGDVFGNRLLRYDMAGHRLEDINLTDLGIFNISDLVGGEDALYILEISFKVFPVRYRVNQLSSSGELLSQYDLPEGFHQEDGLYGLAMGYTPDGDAQLLIQLEAGADSSYFRVPDSAGTTPEKQAVVAALGRKLYEDNAGPGELAVLKVGDEQFESAMTIGGRLSLLFSRPDGSLFLLREDMVAWHPVITTDITIHYLTPQGEQAGTARYPLMDWYFPLGRYLAVGPDGNAYGLITREKTVDILRLNFYRHLNPLLVGATDPQITNVSISHAPGSEYDCSLVEHLDPNSLEAHRIVQEFLDNFHHTWPGEYLDFEQVWAVDRLGVYAVIQGDVTPEEMDIIVVKETAAGFSLATRFQNHMQLPGQRHSDIAAYLANELPTAPLELFYCLDIRRFLSEFISPVSSPSPRPDPTATRTPIITPSTLPTPAVKKEILIRYTSYPGDGGGCMADYLGASAPLLELSSDGQLILQKSHQDQYWYTEYRVEQSTVEELLAKITRTNYFTVVGNGQEYEHDPIYQFPNGFEDFSEGAGTVSLEVNNGEFSKKVTIYIPYMEYLVPEISKALQVVESFKPDRGVPYQPEYWITWVSGEDPCEPYLLNFEPLPDDLRYFRLFLDGKSEGQFFFANTPELNLGQLLGFKPRTFLSIENGIRYYLYTRPVLPNEYASDFSN